MDWKNVVATVAPYLGAAVGGPLGGAAMSVIANTLGLSEKTEGAIKQALSGTTPEQLLALKKADLEFSVRMKEIGLTNVKDMEALAVSDRDSARKREMTVGDKTARNLAYLITAGFFSVLTSLLFLDIPEGSKEVLFVMLGSLGTAWIGVNSYYFGSTAGSSKKTDLLARAEATKD